jgi:hypothetical protein
MLRGKDILLKAGLLLLAIGSLIFFHPFHSEPMWMEWIVGPILFYLGLPLAILGIAIRVFGGVQKSNGALPHSQTRG